VIPLPRLARPPQDTDLETYLAFDPINRVVLRVRWPDVRPQDLPRRHEEMGVGGRPGRPALRTGSSASTSETTRCCSTAARTERMSACPRCTGSTATEAGAAGGRA